MGNCNSCYYENNYITDINLSSKVKNKFIKYNILDKNIIIGIWDNPNKTNTLGNQGIWIGNNQKDKEKIYSLIIGIYYKNLNLITFNFEDNIELQITKQNNKLKLNLIGKDLDNNTNKYTTEISNEIKKNFKKIDLNSYEIDMIFNLFN